MEFYLSWISTLLFQDQMIPVEELAVYVQHDEFVQQVVDEQFLVHCKHGQAHGIVSYQINDKVSKNIDQVAYRSGRCPPALVPLCVNLLFNCS